MSNLRKAAEELVEAWGWDWSEPRNEALKERMEALRQALAQPEWIGLTDEEVESWRGNYDFFDSQLVREVEAKLKEKNT